MILEKVKELQVKHLIQITVCFLAIYLLRSRQAYQFLPAWRKDCDPSLYENGFFPTANRRLPSPVVTNLDGDGRMETILITNDWKLHVARFGKTRQAGKRLPYLDVLRWRNLKEHLGDTGPGARPVAMTTGFLDQYEKDKSRTQVIVVVYSNWFVQCYNDKLELLWQRTLLEMDMNLSEHCIHSMAILVTPHRIHPTDKGLVIIGGSVLCKEHSYSVGENGDSLKEEPSPCFNNSLCDKFSVFALSGLNGTLKWQHLPHAADRTTLIREESSHHWKLSLRRGSWLHVGSHWLKYGQCLLKQMPHQWHHAKDTTLDLADVQRLLDDKKAEGPYVGGSRLDDLGAGHLIGLAFGGFQPHSFHEHVTNPSAVVVHSDKGLELLSLFNGQSITRLTMEDHRAVYGDVNGDGKLDQVLANDADVCQGEVSTVQPHHKALFAGNICSTGWWSGDDVNSPEDIAITVPPIIVKSVSRPRGLINHLLGKTLPTDVITHDSIFLTPSGYITSFNAHGHLNWHVQTAVMWSDKVQAGHHPDYKYTQEGQVFRNAFMPSMLGYSLQIYGPQKHALITGWDNIILVDLEDGYTAAEHSLPCQPLEPPVLADFDGDGWTDVIIYCPTGYVGMSVQSQPQYVYMTALSVTVVLFMLLLSWCSQIDQSNTVDE